MADDRAATSGILIERHGATTLVRMDRGENRLHPDLLSGLECALDEIERREGPAALVVTGTGKYFSNGLDLEFMAANPTEVEANLARVHSLYARLLALDAPTVAAINGHAFAGGGMLALAFDVAVMRADRGWFCLPESDLAMSFTAGMNALVAARLSPPVAHSAMVTGRRFTGEQALAAGIVAELAAEEDVLPRALALAEGLAAKPRAAVGAIRRLLHAHAIEQLEESAAPQAA